MINIKFVTTDLGLL